jgi:hypothetical protein
VAARRVTGPDGREWEVRIVRVRFPQWRPSDFDPWEEACGERHGVLLLLPLALVYWLVNPLLALLVALPFALVRSLFSRRRWIEAEARFPAPILVRWRTTSARAEKAVGEIADALSRGYDVKVKDAELESMTEPPGFRDRDS